MGWKQPNFVDLTLFDVLCSIENCIAFQALLKISNIGSWIFSMKHAMTQHQA